MSAATDMRWKANTCPICERTFTVTPSDDYLIPACGCYDDAEPGRYPCESCGLTHVYACLDRSGPPTRRVAVVVDEDGAILAQAEGAENIEALAGEWFVAPVVSGGEGTHE